MFRTQDLTQLNDKLRLQLAEKDGTITTLTRTNQSQQKVVVSFTFSFYDADDDTLKEMIE